jgi:AhpD family alkylhydroperoxidase
MAIAVGLTTLCPYCLEVHRKVAIAGATLKKSRRALRVWLCRFLQD